MGSATAPRCTRRQVRQRQEWRRQSGSIAIRAARMKPGQKRPFPTSSARGHPDPRLGFRRRVTHATRSCTLVRLELGVQVFWSRSARPQSDCPVTEQRAQAVQRMMIAGSEGSYAETHMLTHHGGFVDNGAPTAQDHALRDTCCISVERSTTSLRIAGTRPSTTATPIAPRLHGLDRQSAPERYPGLYLRPIAVHAARQVDAARPRCAAGRIRYAVFGPDLWSAQLSPDS